MAKQQSKAVSGPQEKGPIGKLQDFFDEVKVELKKVSWPSWEEVKASTQVVLVLLGILAGLVWVYDLVFGKGVLTFIGLF